MKMHLSYKVGQNSGESSDYKTPVVCLWGFVGPCSSWLSLGKATDVD